MVGFGQVLKYINTADIRRFLSEPRRAWFNLTKPEPSGPGFEESARQRKDAFRRLFETSEAETDRLLTELDESWIASRIDEAHREFAHKPYDIGNLSFNGRTLYALSRVVKPETVLEIGVANGISTLYVLGALEQEDLAAHAYGVDLPQFEFVVRERRGRRGLDGATDIIPDTREAGWLAPRPLRSEYEYQYYVGDFTEILADLLDDIRPLDLVFYDASHYPDDMRFAYDQCIEALGPDGVLLSNEVLIHDAFQTVTDLHDGETAVIGDAGLFKKRSDER